MSPDRDRRTLAAETAHLVRQRWDILAVIAVGGAAGSLGRWALSEALPHSPGRLPWATWVENVTGALALGVLMVLVLDLWPPNRYLRPFAGVGVLGGYTTFSTYMLDARDLFDAGEPALGLLYLLGTLATGLAAVWVGTLAGRVVVLQARRRHHA